MGPQDTYVVKMDHLVTRTRVRGELAPSRVDKSLPELGFNVEQQMSRGSPRSAAGFDHKTL